MLFRSSVRITTKFERMHTVGAEYLFNLSILNLVSIILITLLFAGAGVLLRQCTGVSNITNFGSFFFISNISEIAIFGFPVIFNPVMFLPFILTPLAFVLTSSLATAADYTTGV